MPRIWISLHKFHTAKQLSGNLLRMRNKKELRKGGKERSNVYVCVCWFFFTRVHYFSGISFLAVVLTFGCGGL